MKKLNLTAQEKSDVVAFMKALSGETKKLEELLPKLAAWTRRQVARPARGPYSAGEDRSHRRSSIRAAAR